MVRVSVGISRSSLWVCLCTLAIDEWFRTSYWQLQKKKRRTGAQRGEKKGKCMTKNLSFWVASSSSVKIQQVISGHICFPFPSHFCSILVFQDLISPSRENQLELFWFVTLHACYSTDLIAGLLFAFHRDQCGIILLLRKSISLEIIEKKAFSH